MEEHQLGRSPYSAAAGITGELWLPSQPAHDAADHSVPSVLRTSLPSIVYDMYTKC